MKNILKITICYFVVGPNISYWQNQSAESAGVAFVKEGNVRDEYLKKITNSNYIILFKKK